VQRRAHEGYSKRALVSVGVRGAGPRAARTGLNAREATWRQHQSIVAILPSRPLRVLSIVGTRPEAIKMAPVILELGRRTPCAISRVCVTGQHRDLLDSPLALFGIVPDYDLAVMQHAQSPIQVAARVMTELDHVLERERPDWVLVQGDTTTAMAASVVAAYRRVRLGHVEAGLRTHDKNHPFPEEINRRITGVVSDLHFAPTERSRANLMREGESSERIVVTGNPVIDALHMAVAMPFEARAELLSDVPADRRIILLTAHRRENFGRPLERICEAVLTLAEAYRGDVHVVYPVHPNPAVRDTVTARLSGRQGISLMEPLNYLPLVHLMKRSTLVLTDSGGIQEEAPGLGKPVLVLRETTERPEAVEAGTVELVGTDPDRIVARTRELLDDASAYERMARAVNPYGDGKAAQRIADALIRDSMGTP
jgi:UDP-N-acetylglucosamine 2-epimerase (non-hydrolysing)